MKRKNENIKRKRKGDLNWAVDLHFGPLNSIVTRL
jgi:hypothetical protein